MSSLSIKGKDALSKVLTNKKNIYILYKHIMEKTKEEYQEQYNDNNYEDYEDSEEFKTLYFQAIYQVIGDIIQKTKLKLIFANIKEGKLFWKHKTFDKIQSDLYEQDDFIVNPFEVVEGVLQCGKCKSWRTASYQIQQRSCDEPMSTHAQCMGCGNKWVYSG